MSAVVLSAAFLDEDPTVWVALGGAAVVAAGIAVVLENARGEPTVVAPVGVTVGRRS